MKDKGVIGGENGLQDEADRLKDADIAFLHFPIEDFGIPDSEKLDDLDADLSLLGEVLESRFSLEDRLIALLHRSHAAQAANR